MSYSEGQISTIALCASMFIEVEKGKRPIKIAYCLDLAHVQQPFKNAWIDFVGLKRKPNFMNPFIMERESVIKLLYKKMWEGLLAWIIFTGPYLSLWPIG